MTVLLPAWLQTGAYTAEHDRFVGTALLNPSNSLTGRGGVRRVTGTEFQVIQTSTPSMTLSIGPGMAFVQGVSTATQGVYTVVNDDFFNVTISASNPTNPRIDLIVLEILDQTYAGVSNLAQVRVLTGSAASSPSPPTATGSFIALATVLVPANSSALPNANITDLRPFSTALGAPIPVRSLAERNSITGKYDGLRVFMMDNAWEVHTYANGEWYGSDPRFFGVTSFNQVISAVGDYDMRTIVDRAKIPDPGFRYTLRLDMDLFTLGARVNGTAYCETTTTTAFSNKVAYGQTSSWYVMSTGGLNHGSTRLVINRPFPATYTGSRWVTLRVNKDSTEDSATGWQLNGYEASFQITMMPVRPNGLVLATSVGGQP